MWLFFPLKSMQYASNGTNSMYAAKQTSGCACCNRVNGSNCLGDGPHSDLLVLSESMQVSTSGKQP